MESLIAIRKTGLDRLMKTRAAFDQVGTRVKKETNNHLVFIVSLQTFELTAADTTIEQLSEFYIIPEMMVAELQTTMNSKRRADFTIVLSKIIRFQRMRIIASMRDHIVEVKFGKSIRPARIVQIIHDDFHQKSEHPIKVKIDSNIFHLNHRHFTLNYYAGPAVSNQSQIKELSYV